MITPVQSGHASEWIGADIPALSSIAVTLGPAELREIDEAYEACVSRGVTIETLSAYDFPLQVAAPALDRIRREVQIGRGLAVLGGLPVADWSLDKTELVYLGLMSHLGTPILQSVLGDPIGRVQAAGGTDDTRERGYRNAARLALHTDYSPGIVGMFMVRAGQSGGESLFASAVSIHNILCRERPDVLPRLYRGFRFHRLDAARPGEVRVTDEHIPTFSVCDGLLTCRYARSVIEPALVELGEALDAEGAEAMDAFDEVASRPTTTLEALVEPGQIVLTNDLVTLHARRAYTDSPTPGAGRLMLRTWLSAEPRRPRVDLVNAVPRFEKRAGEQPYREMQHAI